MRRVARAVLFATVVGAFLLQALARTAKAAPGKCDVPLIDPVCEAGKTVADKAGDVVSAPVRWAAGGAVDAVTGWVADTARWILERVVAFVGNSTTPTLDAGWFDERYDLMIGLGALVVLPMLLIATIRAVVAQDPSQLVRSYLVHLPVAVLATFMAVHITQALLGITDLLSGMVARNVAGDVSQIFDSVNGTLSKAPGVAGGAAPSFAIFFGALLLVIGSFLVWLELLVRSAAVTAAVFFLPMILAGLVWPATMRWTRRVIEILVALILSKFVIVAVISLATAALSDPGGGGFGTVMGAAALMLMAALSPFALLKLVPMVEGGAIDHLQGRGRAAVDSVRPHGGVHQVMSVVRAKTRSNSVTGLPVAGPATAAGAGATVGAGAAAAAVARGAGRRTEHQSAPERSTTSRSPESSSGKEARSSEPRSRPTDRSRKERS